MRILYVTQYGPPEIGATQTRAWEMASGLVRAGHRVTILTEFPNHPAGVIPDSYRGRWFERDDKDGVEILRVRVAASPDKGFARRLLFYGSFVFMAIVAGLFRTRGRYDLLYVTSPPLFAGVVGLVLGALRRTRMVFEVRDLWPESAVQLGELRNRRVIRLSTWLENTCCRKARHVVTVTDTIRRDLLARGLPEGKVTRIANGADVERFRPRAADPDVRARYDIPEGRFVAAYTGLHGLAHDLGTILEAARILQDEGGFFFLMVGDGPRKEAARERARELGVTDVAFHPAVPEDELARLLGVVDVGLDCRRRLAISEGTLPVKMFTYLACGVPVVLGIEGEAEALVNAAEAGVTVPPESPQELAAAIRALRDDPERCAAMGLRGRGLVEERYSRAAQARELAGLLEEAVR